MKSVYAFASALALSLGTSANAQDDATRVVVTVENLAPIAGTFQTPVWVGFHDGSFDIYDRNVPASTLPSQGSESLERIAEDGSTGPISDEFLALAPAGVDATLLGPGGPVAPGETATGSFVLDRFDPSTRYFSYASMVIPSNDFFIANGNPLAHPIFDENGQVVATDFFVTGAQILDAGTEVNDEVPANTAFFGQQAPNTGLDENGVIIGLNEGLVGFLPQGSGGILDDARFAAGDFLVPGYPSVRISFATAPAITESRVHAAFLSGAEEVPPVATKAFGRAVYRLVDDGTRIEFEHQLKGLRNVVAAHLHLGAFGENGPVVVDLLGTPPANGRLRRLNGDITSQSLTGPLAGQPLDALTAAIEEGRVYINIHTDDGVEPANTGPGDFASGEIRGQLVLVSVGK